MKNSILVSHDAAQLARGDSDEIVGACVNDEQQQLFVAYRSGALTMYSTHDETGSNVRHSYFDLMSGACML